MKYDITSPIDIERFAKEMIGKSFNDILPLESKGFRGKGGLGQLIEKYHFGYSPNNDTNPDFEEAGVELKVTPFRKLKRGNQYSAKERIVLNVINFEEVVKEEFYTSSFWHKNNLLLIMFYLYEEEVEDRLDFLIKYAELFSSPEEDLKIIEDDWNKIVNKIKDGKAHELSEGDTMYLGACTKGSTKAESYRVQPFNDIKAPQRAFSFKNSYVTDILRDYFIPGKKTYKPVGDKITESKDDSIIKDVSYLEDMTFEEFVLNKISNYYGKSMSELCEEFSVNKKAKNATQQVVLKILGVKLKSAKEFERANIQVKAIRIEANGRIKQHMSFPNFKFKEIIKEDWENSSLRTMMEEKKFLFVIYKFDDEGNLYLKKSMFWNIPIKILDNEVKSVWERTVEVIKNGVELIEKNNRTYNNLPGLSENKVSHVRPHAQNKRDTYPLPDGREMTKQSFWLNNNFILEQINNEENS